MNRDRAANRIDLHLHTDASDGAVSAEILVARAALAGLTTLAITEHDNVDSWDRGRQAARRCGIRLLPGIEISVRHRNQDVHLLGYDFSPSSRPMRELIDHQGMLRHARFDRMLKLLRGLGLKISSADVHTEKTAAPGRVHVAQALVASRIVPNVETAFEKYLRKGRPAYVPYETVSAEDTVRIVHEAGGFVSLAHPIFGAESSRMLDELVDTGIDAIEVLHPKHSPRLQADLTAFCERRHLMMTGGSDWHGTLDESYDLGEWYLLGNGKSSSAPQPSLSRILESAKPVRPGKRRARTRRPVAAR